MIPVLLAMLIIAFSAVAILRSIGAASRLEAVRPVPDRDVEEQFWDIAEEELDEHLLTVCEELLGWQR